jgi:hypothetical protein
MRQSLWYGSLLVMISGSLLGCVATDAEDGSLPRAMTVTRKPSHAAEIGQGPRQAGEGESARAGEVGYPAPHPSMPQIPIHGGVVLHDPVIVSVTFPGDKLADKIAQFGEEVGSLKWWSTVNSPYGVGPGRSGGHVVAPEAPADALTDTDVEQWIADKIDDGTLPAPTDQTIYTMYYPSTTSVTLDDAASCQQFLGYHSAFEIKRDGQPMLVSYAVIARCGDLDQVTETASHEFTEAATDPHPITIRELGYMLLSSNAWTLLGGENADMCAGVAGVRENGWNLTRSWINQNAAIGQQPCLPVEDDGVPYFNAGIVRDTIATEAGTTVTTEVDCYSFGPLPAPMELSIQSYGKSGLRFALDRKSCRNGDKLSLTISVPKEARRGADYHYSLISRIDDRTGHLWRGLVHVR